MYSSFLPIFIKKVFEYQGSELLTKKTRRTSVKTTFLTKKRRRITRLPKNLLVLN